MAFTIEHDFSQSEKERYRRYHKAQKLSHQFEKPSFWAVDRERDAYLAWIEGAGYKEAGHPRFYLFIWKGQSISVEVYQRIKCEKDGSETIYYKIVGISAPKDIQSQEQNMLELLKEAIITMAKAPYYIKPHCVFEYIERPKYM